MILQANNLFKTYKSRTIVQDVCLQIPQGQIIGLFGPNGSGKTTTFYMLAGLLTPDTGSVWMDQENITALPLYQRAQKGLSYLPQEPSIFRHLSIEDNLMAVLELTTLPKALQKQKVETLLLELGLVHIRKNLGHAVSGGERRKTEIARGIAQGAQFLLLDEPFSAIDPKTVEELQQILLKLKAQGMGIFLTDHNVGESLGITDWSYLMFSGKIFKQGAPQDIAYDPQARDLYLGKHFQLQKKV